MSTVSENLLEEIGKLQARASTANGRVLAAAEEFKALNNAFTKQKENTEKVRALIEDTVQQYGAVLDASIAANGGASVPSIQRSHTKAVSAVDAAEANSLRMDAILAQAKASVWKVSPAVATVKDNLMVIMALTALAFILLIEYFIFRGKLGGWHLVPLLVIVLFFVATAKQLVEDRKWTRTSIARQLGFHGGVIVALIVISMVGSAVTKLNGPDPGKTPTPTEVTGVILSGTNFDTNVSTPES